MTKTEAVTEQQRLAKLAPPGINSETEGWYAEPYDLDALMRQAPGR